MNETEELNLAAANLVQRAVMLLAKSEVIARVSWSRIRFTPPTWWALLLERFPLAGLVLEYRDRTDGGVQLFSVPSAVGYEGLFPEGGVYDALVRHGWFPVGSASDGDLWIIRAADGPAGEVYLLEHSSWDGGEPSTKNGLRFAASRLSYLLLSMSISEATYYQCPLGPTRVLWYRAR